MSARYSSPFHRKRPSPCYENHTLDTKGCQWQQSSPEILFLFSLPRSLFIIWLFCCFFFSPWLPWLYILSRAMDAMDHNPSTRILKIFHKSVGGFVNYQSDICPLGRKELSENNSHIRLSTWLTLMTADVKTASININDLGVKTKPCVFFCTASLSWFISNVFGCLAFEICWLCQIFCKIANEMFWTNWVNY